MLFGVQFPRLKSRLIAETIIYLNTVLLILLAQQNTVKINTSSIDNSIIYGIRYFEFKPRLAFQNIFFII